MEPQSNLHGGHTGMLVNGDRNTGLIGVGAFTLSEARHTPVVPTRTSILKKEDVEERTTSLWPD